MKKGQISPIFTWIFVLILAMSILFFGIKTVRQGESLKDEVLLIDFYKNLEKRINNYYYLDIGSSGTEEFILPSGVRKVCFIDEDNTLDSYYEQFRTDTNDEGFFSNIFIEPRTEFKETRSKIDKFYTVKDPFCSPVIGGRLKLVLGNAGIKGVVIDDKFEDIKNEINP